MPKRQVEMMGPEERRFVTEDEIPSDHIILPDGTVLGPTQEGEVPDAFIGPDGLIYPVGSGEQPEEEEEGEFFQGPDGMIYPVGGGIDPNAEHDEADDDAGYYKEEDVDFSDDGTSEEDDYDEDEGWDPDSGEDYYEDDEE